jgi:hypothetical protein
MRSGKTARWFAAATILAAMMPTTVRAQTSPQETSPGSRFTATPDSGVIKPPPTEDSGLRKPPPADGSTIKVIPPPGTPGSGQNVVPK